MTLLLAEGWDDGLAPVQKYSYYNATGSLSQPAEGRNSGYCWKSLLGHYYNYLPFNNSSTVIFGFALKSQSTSWTDQDFYTFTLAATASRDIAFKIDNTTRKMTVYRLNTAYTGGTSTFMFDWQSWYYVEAKVVIHATTGSIEVRVNGSPIITLTNINTTMPNGGYTYANMLIIGGLNYYDDIYVCNDSGTTNNDFLGDVRIETLRPNGNGTYSQGVGSDGNSTDNYLLTNKETPNAPDGFDTFSTATVSAVGSIGFGSVNNTNAVDGLVCRADGVGSGIRWDLGSAMNVRGFRKQGQHSSNAPTSISIEYSDDNTNWTLLQTFSGLTNGSPSMTYDVLLSDATQTHRYWRYKIVTGSYDEFDAFRPLIVAPYVAFNASGNKDLYTFQNLATTSGTVAAVQTTTIAAKATVGTSTVRPLMRNGATEATGAGVALGTSYTMSREVFETKPGGGAWTITDVNASEFGIERTA